MDILNFRDNSPKKYIPNGPIFFGGLVEESFNLPSGKVVNFLVLGFTTTELKISKNMSFEDYATELAKCPLAVSFPLSLRSIRTVSGEVRHEADLVELSELCKGFLSTQGPQTANKALFKSAHLMSKWTIVRTEYFPVGDSTRSRQFISTRRAE